MAGIVADELQLHFFAEAVELPRLEPSDRSAPETEPPRPVIDAGPASPGTVRPSLSRPAPDELCQCVRVALDG